MFNLHFERWGAHIRVGGILPTCHIAQHDTDHHYRGSDRETALADAEQENADLREQIEKLKRQLADAELRAATAEADGLRMIEVGLARMGQAHRAQRPKKWEALSTLAKQVKGLVSRTTIWNWCVEKKVEARQNGLGGPWEIELVSFWDRVESHAKRLGKPFTRSAISSQHAP